MNRFELCGSCWHSFELLVKYQYKVFFPFMFSPRIELESLPLHHENQLESCNHYSLSACTFNFSFLLTRYIPCQLGSLSVNHYFVYSFCITEL